MAKPLKLSARAGDFSIRMIRAESGDWAWRVYVVVNDGSPDEVATRVVDGGEEQAWLNLGWIEVSMPDFAPLVPKAKLMLAAAEGVISEQEGHLLALLRICPPWLCDAVFPPR